MLPTAKSKPTWQNGALHLATYLAARDFVGAATLLRLHEQHALVASLPPRENAAASISPMQYTTWWRAFCAFRCGDPSAALQDLDALLASAAGSSGSAGSSSSALRDTWALSRACCLCAMHSYEEAEQAALLTPRTALGRRLLYVLGHARDLDAATQRGRYQQLEQEDSVLDQLAIAYVAFQRGEFQTSLEMYAQARGATKRSTRGIDQDVADDQDDRVALAVYEAMCWHQLGLLDRARDALDVFMMTARAATATRGAFTAVNLRACTTLQLQGTREALQELDAFVQQHDLAWDAEAADLDSNSMSPMQALYLHNREVFRAAAANDDRAVMSENTSDAQAIAMLQALIDLVPEARMNLVLLHLRRHEYHMAFALVEDLAQGSNGTAVNAVLAPPALGTTEHMALGVLHGKIAEQTASNDHALLAIQHFQRIGTSPQEKDTIAGRQAMASYHMLRREYREASLFLESIAAFLPMDDAFHWNLGMAYAAMSRYREAEHALHQVQCPRLRKDVIYCCWLARCYIADSNGARAALAWDLYLQIEDTADAFTLLQQLAIDFFHAREFLWAAKAYDVLERVDPADPIYWEGKRSACVSSFQNGASSNHLIDAAQREEVLQLLRQSKHHEEEAAHVAELLETWLHSVA